ncbi:YveK family protein [Lachnobacterium bovis]|uniref:YveK family protein n=1 Tax=Lachnobacterium bovis TaxID=140626 RepID=UPI0004854EE5|nr:Wzz/FepE/Etk N-terminal domain-containing protein [Lachnobacterium bovis]
MINYSNSNAQNEQIEDVIDIGEILYILWSHFLIVLTVVIIFATAAFFATQFFIEPQYTSETGVYVLTKQDQHTITTSDLTAGNQLTSDYAELVTSRPVLEKTIENVGLTNITTEELKKSVSVYTPDNTRILKIRVTYNNPQIARDLANTLRKEVSNQIVDVMNIDAVNTVEKASLPTKPSSPNIIKNTILGGVIGFFFIAVIVIAVNKLDDTVKTPEDVENLVGLTVLASIPVKETEKVSNRKKRKEKKKNKRDEYGTKGSLA